MPEPTNVATRSNLDMKGQSPIRVEVVCAVAARQRLVVLQLPAGTTARQAVQQAQLDGQFPEVDIATAPLAVFGTVVAEDYCLSAGERVEVLRPLLREPRDARRELAARGQTMLSRQTPAED